MDHNVPAAITAGLQQHNVDVLTAFEDGAAELDDELLLERASELGRVLFSQDTDLLVLAEKWLRANRSFAGLVFAHQMNITIGQATRDLILLTQVVEPHEMRNRIEFLPL